MKTLVFSHIINIYDIIL